MWSRRFSKAEHLAVSLVWKLHCEFLQAFFSSKSPKKQFYVCKKLLGSFLGYLQSKLLTEVDVLLCSYKKKTSSSVERIKVIQQEHPEESSMFHII